MERVFDRERVYLSLSLSLCAPRYRPRPECLREKNVLFSIFQIFTKTSKKKILEEEEEEEEEEIRRYNIHKHTDRPRDHFFFSLSLVLSLEYARDRERAEITPRDGVLLRARLLQLLVVFWYFGSKRELVFFFFVVLSTRFVAAATAAGAKRSVF